MPIGKDNKKTVIKVNNDPTKEPVIPASSGCLQNPHCEKEIIEFRF